MKAMADLGVGFLGGGCFLSRGLCMEAKEVEQIIIVRRVFRFLTRPLPFKHGLFVQFEFK